MALIDLNSGRYGREVTWKEIFFLAVMLGLLEVWRVGLTMELLAAPIWLSVMSITLATSSILRSRMWWVSFSMVGVFLFIPTGPYLHRLLDVPASLLPAINALDVLAIGTPLLMLASRLTNDTHVRVTGGLLLLVVILKGAMAAGMVSTSSLAYLGVPLLTSFITYALVAFILTLIPRLVMMMKEVRDQALLEDQPDLDASADEPLLVAASSAAAIPARTHGGKKRPTSKRKAERKARKEGRS